MSTLRPVLFLAFIQLTVPSLLPAWQLRQRPAQSASRATGSSASQSADYSQEPFVIEQAITDIKVQPNGALSEEHSLRIRVQSNIGVQAVGVMSIAYRQSTDQPEILRARVIKPDGKTVDTAAADAQDVPTQATQLAPTYSDLRVKQLPIRGLSAGDVLEWQTRVTATKPIVPDHFWYDYDFQKKSVVLEESVRIALPLAMIASIDSGSGYPSESVADNAYRVYTWKSHHLEPTSQKKTEAKEEEEADDTVPIGYSEESEEAESANMHDIRISTFSGMDKVGEWYRGLITGKDVPSATVKNKALELTEGLTSRDEKLRKLYSYVSTQIRYVAILLGQGRYEPHSAEEVLANQYGDCKDKHTLLAALLNAVGIEAWPALIGPGLPNDTQIPSPGLFNHLITYIPGDGAIHWLDSTPPVVPYGLLLSPWRDQQALVVPPTDKPSLMRTPAQPPFAADETLVASTKLDARGKLTGRFEYNFRGDSEVVFRLMYHNTPPTKWAELTQSVAGLLGFGGKTSSVEVGNPANSDAPFKIAYDYEREDYSTWSDGSISAPIARYALMQLALAKPNKPLVLGALGTHTQRSTIVLPEGYSATLPANTAVQTTAADYSMTYSHAGTTITTELKLVRKKSKLEASDWPGFAKLVDAVKRDLDREFRVVKADGASTITRANPEVPGLIDRANDLLQKRQYTQAHELLVRAEQLDENALGLWRAYAIYYDAQNLTARAIESMQREIRNDPGYTGGYSYLASLQERVGQYDEALETLRHWIEAEPENVEAVGRVAYSLNQRKQYSSAIEVLQSGLEKKPNNEILESLLLESYLWRRDDESAAALLEKLHNSQLPATQKGFLADLLLRTGGNPEEALAFANSAAAELEQDASRLTIAPLDSKQISFHFTLRQAWETLGTAYLHKADRASAEKYLLASFELSQHAYTASLLGRMYERLGKLPEAVRYYEYALSIGKNQSYDQDSLNRVLELASKSGDGKGAIPRSDNPAADLSQLRSKPVPGFAHGSGSAEFVLLISGKGIEDAVLQTQNSIPVDKAMEGAIPFIKKVAYNSGIPAGSPARLQRKAILSCTPATRPNCNLVFYLLEDTFN